MNYLYLVYLDAAHWDACDDRVCADYVRRLIAGEPLHPTHTATTVRVRNGEVTVYDGPFAETREMLAGIPPARHGSIEVRPVRELQTGEAT